MGVGAAVPVGVGAGVPVPDTGDVGVGVVLVPPPRTSCFIACKASVLLKGAKYLALALMPKVLYG